MRRRADLAALFVAAAAVAAAGCYDGDDFSPTEPLLRSILTLGSESGATEVPADGFSRLRLVARVSSDTALGRRAVLFSTTGGRLAGGTPEGDAVRVEPDGGGRAVVDLVSASDAGTAVVTARLAEEPGIAASLAVEFTPADPASILRFVVAPASAPADGATVTALTVELSPQLPSEARQVVFRTTAGGFAPGGGSETTVLADAGSRATTDLVSAATVGPARVQATAAGVTREVVVEMVPALPETVDLTASPPSLTAGVDAVVELTATLRRTVGRVGAGTEVVFSAGRGTLGRRLVVADDEGTATTMLFVHPEAAGTFTVTARAARQGGGEVVGETTIVVSATGFASFLLEPTRSRSTLASGALRRAESGSRWDRGEGGTISGPVLAVIATLSLQRCRRRSAGRLTTLSRTDHRLERMALRRWLPDRRRLRPPASSHSRPLLSLRSRGSPSGSHTWCRRPPASH